MPRKPYGQLAAQQAEIGALRRKLAGEVFFPVERNRLSDCPDRAAAANDRGAYLNALDHFAYLYWTCFRDRAERLKPPV